MPIYESSLGAATCDPEPTSPTENPLPVPSKEEKSNIKQFYTMKSPMATILMYRQTDLSIPQTISSAAEVYMNEKVDLPGRVSQLLGNDDEFWGDFVQNYGDVYIREHNPQEIEQKVLCGIPEDFRWVTYLSILNVKYTVELQTYESLVKKAKLADFEGGSKYGSTSTEHRELVQVYWYCLKGTAHENAQTTGLLSPKLIDHVARVLVSVKGLSKTDSLALLFKLAEVFAHVSNSEFCFLGSRALEDFVGEPFIHVTKQGINILGLFNTAVERVFDASLDTEISLQVLDFILLEGVEFVLRLFCAVFAEQTKKILSLDGDQLKEYIYSQALVSCITKATLKKSTEVELPIIKYENEFSLLNANSVSGNDNEVSNLKETNEELTNKLTDLQEKYSQLQKTHEEIFGQNAEYSRKLAEARDNKAALIERKEALVQKYSHLTMQENLNNTIKANLEISRENQDLESQIEVMQKKVDAKTRTAK